MWQFKPPSYSQFSWEVRDKSLEKNQNQIKTCLHATITVYIYKLYLKLKVRDSGYGPIKA